VTVSRDRQWWWRTARLVHDPAPAFAGVEDRTPDDEQARAEPLAAIVVLAGIGGTLMTTFAGRVLDEERLDAVELALWAFIGGAFDGVAAYWIVGALAYVGGVAAGSAWTYKQARHVLGFAAVPLALSLALWPIRLALFGTDNFRAGGGAGETAFDWLGLVFLAWAALLLVYGIRVAHAWAWPRALAAAALPLLIPVLALLRTFGAV
jgi:hypothetical protein